MGRETFHGVLEKFLYRKVVVERGTFPGLPGTTFIGIFIIVFQIKVVVGRETFRGLPGTTFPCHL